MAIHKQDQFIRYLFHDLTKEKFSPNLLKLTDQLQGRLRIESLCNSCALESLGSHTCMDTFLLEHILAKMVQASIPPDVMVIKMDVL